MSRVRSSTYQFGDFRLDTAARELRRHGKVLELPRLVFGALALLVEHRDRAVSREALIEAVWGRPHVDDVLVNQIIMRLRRAIGDDSQNPVYIRTVPGFGYQWIAETTEEPAPRRRPGGWQLPLLLILTVVAITLLARACDVKRTPPLIEREPGTSVVILPLEVRTGDESEAGWIRLGAMDLIAGRLRDAGMPVPPSDNVVAAVHAAEALPQAGREQALRRTLAAGILIQGVVQADQGLWIVELTAVAAGGEQRRVTSGPAEIIPASRRAADQLLAALGSRIPAAEGMSEPLSERLQRARAAILTLELDTARGILAAAPPDMRDEPELLHDLAWVEFLAGEIGVAQSITATLLDQPGVVSRPDLHARVWIMRGNIAMRAALDWGVGVPYFDTAIGLLHEQPWAPERATALALRGGARNALHEFDIAARDLGQARAIFEISGDRLGAARVHNYIGNLELERGRPADALSPLLASLDVFESYGHVNGQRANLYALARAHAQLLRRADALDAARRLWTLHARVQDPTLRDAIATTYPAMLIEVGRHDEAAAILDAAPAHDHDALSFTHLRHEAAARAELAWRRGAPDHVLEIIADVLRAWPTSGSPVARYPAQAAELTLLYQRASIAAAQPEPASELLSDMPGLEEEPARLVAGAEWAAFQGDHRRAEVLFGRALTRAEHHAVPANVVLVTRAYADWLLGHGRGSEIVALAGRVADWAEHDFEAALMQVVAFHAGGQHEAWIIAVERARRLAGQREIPDWMLSPPDGS